MGRLIEVPVLDWSDPVVATNPVDLSNAELIGDASDASPITNTLQSTNVYGGSGNDSIYNYGGNVKIFSGSGNDYVYSNVYYGSSWGLVTIDAGSGNDTIYNNDPSVSLCGGSGNDSIYFNRNFSGVTINGDTGNDTITASNNSGSGAVYQFTYGDGQDVIKNCSDGDTVSIDGSYYYTRTTIGSNVLISLISGDTMTLLDASDKKITVKGGSTRNPNVGSYLINYNNNSLVSGSNSADTVYNYANNVTVSTADANDYVYNNGTSARVSLGAGNDSLVNWSSGAITAYGGDGNDFLYNSSLGTGVYFDSGDGKDTILNVGDRARFYGSYGTDSLENWGNYVTLAGEGDNDTLVNRSFANNTTWGQNNSLSGGSGNDVISLYGGAAGITVKGGAGNDSIFNDSLSNRNGVTYQFTQGDGVDVIYNFASNDTVSLSGDYYDMSTIGSSVVISLVGGEKISLVGAAGKTVNVTGGNAFTVIENYNKNSLVGGTSYNDTIKNYAGGVTIKGNYGDDYIYNSTSSRYTINNSYGYVTVDGGAGNDSIFSNDPYVSLNGGAGQDTITSGNWQGVTITGGTGNDKIHTSYNSNGVLYRYAYGDGLDTIEGYNSNDTITVTGASSYETVTSGDNLIVKVNGANAMILVNAKGKTVNINPSAVINNYNDNSLVSGSASNDTINNYGSTVTVNALGGNDYIYSSKGYVTIDGGSGNDTVDISYLNRVSVNGGADSDSLNLYSIWYSTINAGDGNDKVLVTYRAMQDSINAGAGNDTISLSGSSFFTDLTLTGGTGNDTFFNDNLNDGLLYQYNYGDGQDLFTYWSANDTISLDGSDYMLSTVNSDIIVSVGSVYNNTFTANGAMTLSGAKTKTVNITGGKPFEPNQGKYITNYNDKSLLGGSAYADTIYNYGDYVTVNAGNGADTIYNSTGNNTSINAGGGNDSIYGINNYVTIDAGDGSDTISGDHYYSKLFGGAGNDSINITNYWGNTIDGGTGDDTIYAGGGNQSINGGAGADRISINSGSTYTGITVTGGTGNDVIYNTAGSSAGVLYQYAKGDGYDILYNYGSNDTISITGADSWSTQLSGNDVLINVADSGTITLSNAKDLTLNIYPKKAEVTPQDIIKKFMKSLDTTTYSGTPALNQAVNFATNGYFPDAQTAIDQMVADCASSSSYTSFLKNYCDIDLSNSDTGAITGSDAGGSTVKDKYSIVPESGSLDTTFNANSFKTDYGVTFYLSETDLSSDERYVWQALKTWWANESLGLIKESYDYSFTDSDATVKNITVVFEENYQKSRLAYTGWPQYINGVYTRVLGINKRYYYDFSNTDTNGTSPAGQCYLDRVVAHELTHAVMMAKILPNSYGFSNLPQFITEGTAELTHGIDDKRTSNIISLAKNSSSLASALSFNPGTSNSSVYAAGYMFLRYLAKQGAAHYAEASDSTFADFDNFVIDDSAESSATLSGNVLTLAKEFDADALDLNEDYPNVKTVDATALSRDIVIYGNTSANSIVTGTGNDTISANTGNDTLDGGQGDDVLFGDAGNDSINGNEGDDTLSGGSGDDTLTGGEGADLFVFGQNCGNDTITDYAAGEDKIQLSETSIVDYAVSGSDIVFALEQNDSLTVKGGKGKQITIIDQDGDETTEKYSTDEEDTTLIIADKTKSPVTLDDNILTADASAVTSKIKIVGNALDNTILGGKKNDTLDGGAGDDLLTGNGGKDVFICGDGNDTVTDYETSDKISLGSAQIVSYSFTDDDAVVLSFGDEKSLTIQNGAGKNISFVNGKKTDTLVFKSDKITNAKTTAVTLQSSQKTFSAAANSKLVTIDGSQTSGVSITGNDKGNYIVAGAGGSTLDGGAGNDTLSGGTGEDVFVYKSAKKSGKDVVKNFDENDSLEISGATVNNASTNAKNQNVVFTLSDKNTITFQKAADEISFTDDDGSKTFSSNDQFIHGDNSVTIPAAFTPPKGVAVTLDSDVAVVDAHFSAKALNLVTENTDGVSILGGTKNDTLTGGDGDDTLWGGKGNDWLYCGDGEDVLHYEKGDGKDFIFGFGDDDLLEIVGLSGNVTGSFTGAGNEYTIKVGKTAVAVLKDFTATSFNVKLNGERVTLS